MNKLFKQCHLKTLIIALVSTFCMTQPSVSYASKHDQVTRYQTEHITIHKESRRPSRRNQDRSTYYIYEGYADTDIVSIREGSKRSKNRHRNKHRVEEYQFIDSSGARRNGEQVYIYEGYE